MPRKKAIKNEEEEALDADLALEQVPDDMPKTKTPTKGRKKKATTPASPDDDGDEEGGAKKKSSAKKPKFETGVPFTDEWGFTNIYPSIIYK